MPPVRVTAPAGPVVQLGELKAHLRVVGDHDDALLADLEKAAVAHLDGWRGVLGRCIHPQTWRIDLEAAGLHRLPFPDVTEVTALDADEAPVDFDLMVDAIGAKVCLSGPATVTFTCALPEDALPAVRAAIKIWVAARYDAVEGVSRDAAEAAVDALIRPLRRVLP